MCSFPAEKEVNSCHKHSTRDMIEWRHASNSASVLLMVRCEWKEMWNKIITIVKRECVVISSNLCTRIIFDYILKHTRRCTTLDFWSCSSCLWLCSSSRWAGSAHRSPSLDCCSTTIWFSPALHPAIVTSPPKTRPSKLYACWFTINN